jgi:hypothetical protein
MTSPVEPQLPKKEYLGTAELESDFLRHPDTIWIERDGRQVPINHTITAAAKARRDAEKNK